MNYFIVKNGQQAGPFPVNQLLAEGVTPTTQVWCEGMANWKPAAEVPEVAAILNPPIPQVEETVYQQPPQPVYQQSAQPAGPTYQQPQYQPKPAMPDTHMVKSILVMLFCCQVFGIIGIVYAAGVSSAYNAGNYAEAQAKSDAANKWCNWGLIGGAIFGVLYVILLVILALTGALS